MTTASGTSSGRSTEHGYLLPAAWYNVKGAGPYEVTANVSDDTLVARAVGKQSRISFSSGRFQPRVDEVPARCGIGGEDDDPDVPFGQNFPEAKADGAASTYQRDLGDGAVLSVSQEDPALERVHPDAFRTLAAGTASQSVFVGERHLDRLLASPGERTEIERWQAEGPSGLGFQGVLVGSLNDGFRLQVIATQDGKEIGRDATDLMGVPCNRRSVLEYDLPDRTVALMFVSDGAQASVDGESVAALADDPALMGSWIATEVPRGGEPVRVTIERTGDEKPLTEVEFNYIRPTEPGAGS